MTCTEHDRAHCPEPRCHVLAVCIAEVRRYAGTTGPIWASYGLSLAYPVEAIGSAMAARLVAWMRWRGERRQGPVPHWFVGYDMRQDDYWASITDRWPHFPGTYHPLDALAPHHKRVKALAGVCDQRHGGMSVGELRRHLGSPACGTNWATVLVYLDWLVEQGWHWDTVHEWREPGTATEPSDPVIWTDQDFQEMAASYPFSWVDIREAANVWREWLHEEITPALLNRLCQMAGRTGTRPASHTDALARMELLGRNATTYPNNKV